MADDGGTAQMDWERFYVQNRRALTAYAAALAGSMDEGLDLIQEVLVRLMAADCAPRAPRAYVLRCLRNLAMDRRGRRPVLSAELADAAAVLDCAAECMEQREEIERILAALCATSEAQRETIVLKIFSGLTFEEIALVLERPLGTVTSSYARGIDVLRRRLAGERDDDERGTGAATGRAARA